MTQTTDDFIARNKEKINIELEKILDQDKDALGEETNEASKYTVLNGGHRCRPLLTLATYRTLKINCQEKYLPKKILNAACAIELIHSASLIHDDIMDESNIRRGKDCCHIRYGNAIAELAVTYLVSRAYELFNAANKRPALESAISAVKSMIHGQSLDTSYKVKDESSLLNAHKLKSSIYRLAGEIGAIFSDAGSEIMTKISRYSELLGIAYLMHDDVIDVEGTPKNTGKPNGQDKKLGKFTAIDAYGIEGSKRKRQELADKAAAEIYDLRNNTILLGFVERMKVG
ncbi:polyprenyl synthetase family protein [Candidatus Woesearchaeota archaeon]|nr:polyprenyl synthetase family protein [Candidatus Woesearchaeota archaeon]